MLAVVRKRLFSVVYFLHVKDGSASFVDHVILVGIRSHVRRCAVLRKSVREVLSDEI